VGSIPIARSNKITPKCPKFTQHQKEFDEKEQGTKASRSSAPCLLISSRARVTRVSGQNTSIINWENFLELRLGERTVIGLHLAQRQRSVIRVLYEPVRGACLKWCRGGVSQRESGST
jgi:hypothetical protein